MTRMGLKGAGLRSALGFVPPKPLQNNNRLDFSSEELKPKRTGDRHQKVGCPQGGGSSHPISLHRNIPPVPLEMQRLSSTRQSHRLC